MIIHVYNHHVAPYFSDTGGFWVGVDENGKYRGRTKTLQEWRMSHPIAFYRGKHPSRCPLEVASIQSALVTDRKEYSIYWFEAPDRAAR